MGQSLVASPALPKLGNIQKDAIRTPSSPGLAEVKKAFFLILQFASMDGQAEHEAALLCIRTALGFAMPSDEVFLALRENGVGEK